MESPDNERRHEVALVLALEMACTAADDTELHRDTSPISLATRIWTLDWIVRQVVLYELGGLADFVLNVAGRDLRARAEHMSGWASAPMSAFQQVDETPEQVRLLDLATEEEIDVLNLGSMVDVEPGGFMLGRVVPISTEPGQMFETRPQRVDEQTARRFAERWRDYGERASEADWGCECDPDACHTPG